VEGLTTVPSVLKGTTAIKPMVDPQPFQVGLSMVSSTTDPRCTFTNATDGTMTSIGMPATGAGRPLWPRKAMASNASKEPLAGVAVLPTHAFVRVDSDAGTGPTLDIAPSDRSEEMADNGLAATAAKDSAGGMPATQVATIGPGVPPIGTIVDATIVDKKPPDREVKYLPESSGVRRPRVFRNGTGNGEQNFVAETEATKEAKEMKETAPMRLMGRLNIGDSSVRCRGSEISCCGHGGELIHGTTCGMVEIPPTDRVVGNPGMEKIGLSTHLINRMNGIDNIAEVVSKVGAEKKANLLGPPRKR
jgi:hypothetical protein